MSISTEELGSGADGAAHIAAMTTATTEITAPSDGASATSSLERYLAEIDDPLLRENISREIGGLQRQFGLVFERHHPEGIRLPKHKVKRGSKVVISSRNDKAVKDSVFYRVQRVHRDESTALIVDARGNEQIIPIDDLTVAKEFGDIMYPGLRKLSEVRRGDTEGRVHTIINGENYHALEVLQYTHAGKVDLIYIDPPYNTGNADWKYNDRYVDAKDGYRHSKWLSFMEKRLEIAKGLLTPTGVICLSIGDDEHHRLRVLADQVFGEGNFIGSISRKAGAGGRQHQYLKQTLDYVLVYRRSSDAPGFLIPTDAKYLSNFKDEDDNGTFRTEPLYKATLDAVGRRMRYWIECPDGSLCIPPGSTFPPLVEGEAIVSTSNTEKRWRWSPETFAAQRDQVVFKETKTSPLLDEHGNQSKWNVYTKQYLDAEAGTQPLDYWDDVPNTLGTKRLIKLGVDFPYPKPTELVERLARMVGNPSAVILDFFGGSGTTAEAVIRLNAEDGGTRQCILVTNNELSKADDAKLRKAGHQPGDDEYEALGVFHHVTRPRLETVVTGVRQDGSKYSDGLDANVAFFELTYLDEPEIVTGRALEDLAGLFWLKAGGAGSILEATPDAKREGFVLSDSGRTAVLLTPGRAAELAERLRTSGRDITHLFIVTDSAAQGDEAASHFPAGITVERIYGSYLEAFQVNRKD